MSAGTIPIDAGGRFAGYASAFGIVDESGDMVMPADLRHACLVLVGYWFEHRDAVIVAGSGAVVPAGFDRLLAPYRRVSL